MRVVDVVGGTGAGKSAIGNAVANHLPPPAGNGFKEGQTAESETTEVATLTTQVTLAQPLPSGISGYTLSWSDTQGVSDTNGRTVDFLDHIVEHMRANPPNGIVLMYNAEQKDTASVRLGHKAMKLCFNESLPDGRTILVMNKMKSLRGLVRSHGQGASDEYNRIYTENLANICSALDLDKSLSNVIPVEFGALDGSNNAWIQAMHTRIGNLPSQPMDCSRFKTFTEIMKRAHQLRDNAVDAHTVAEDSIKDMESRNANIRGDIEWHNNCIKVTAASIAATATAGAVSSVALGVFSFGFGAAVAGGATAAAVASLTAALANSKAKLPALQADLKRNEAEIVSIRADKEGNLKREQVKYVAFLKEVEEVEHVMSLSVKA